MGYLAIFTNSTPLSRFGLVVAMSVCLSVCLMSLPDVFFSMPLHIVPCGKFQRIGGATPKTFPSENYDAPEEVGGDRKCFDSPIRKLGLI